MTYKIIITDSAFFDLENIKSFIVRGNQEIAKKYVSKIFDRLEQLETHPFTGIKISNTLFDYARAYYLVCANHVAIYQINEVAKCIYILRALSHYQDWKDIVNKDILNKNEIVIEDDELQIVKANQSMYYDFYRNSQDEDNKKYASDEVFGSLEESVEVVNQIINNYKSDNGPFVYAVLRKSDASNVGYVQLVKTKDEWEIGYHIAKIFTGNGYATKAVNLFLSHIKNNMGIKELFAITLFSNKASRKVLEKCGFKTIFEGNGLYKGSKRKIIKLHQRI